MRFHVKNSELSLLLIVSLMAFGANLPEEWASHLVDRNLLLIALSVTVFISLFRYLKLMLFLTVSVLAIGANLPDQLATQLGISPLAFTISTAVLVVVALAHKWYYRGKPHAAQVAQGEFELPAAEDDAPVSVSHLRDTLDSRNSVLSAITSGNFSALHQLLISDVEVNFSQDGQIPIFVAIERGYVDVVLLLLIHGAKLRIKNVHGESPTDVALKLRLARIAKLLHYAESQNMCIQNRAVYSSQQNRKLAVMFADISGSTALYDQLGNEAALNMVTRTLNLLKQEVARHGGTLIKTIGDEVLCTFPNALSAAQAARAMHIAVDTEKPGDEHPIAVRIGLHFGDVILKANDVFGDTVNVAARITSVTRARQTMTTQELINALPADAGHSAVPVARAAFKGKQDAMAIYELPWEGEAGLSKRIGDATLRRMRAEASLSTQSVPELAY
ncbi:MAG: adenylate/guanylate cyclase domain-containing protein [Sideroxydans sp.]|nr:adenylate/guanylate cyclase domain-containing protein [Sideroxydans sp.]